MFTSLHLKKKCHILCEHGSGGRYFAWNPLSWMQHCDHIIVTFFIPELNLCNLTPSLILTMSTLCVPVAFTSSLILIHRTQRLFVHMDVRELFKNVLPFFPLRVVGGGGQQRENELRERRIHPEATRRLKSISLWKICSTRQITSLKKVFIIV